MGRSQGSHSQRALRAIRVIIRPWAALELDDAFCWYEAKEVGLGRRFLKAADRLIARIADNPKLYAVIRGDVRCGQIRPFPYLLFYRVIETQITVIAVIHAMTNTRTWKSRIDRD